MRKVPVAIFGGGVVGGGVAAILAQRAALFAQRGLEFQLKYLVVRDLSKPRDFDVPASTIVTDSHDRVLSDDSVTMVVEVMGGMDAARRVVFESAQRGKHVVTANKALLAAHLPDVIKAFPAERRPRLGFEASVAGGIPIIRAAQQSLTPDSVQCVAGILNGTTNYMLTQGFSEAGSYAGALALAQRLGYAEADPTADVAGHDAANKLVLLARLAFGAALSPSDVATRGIPVVTAQDMAYAAQRGYAVRLIGRAERSSGGGGLARLHSYVGPALVSAQVGEWPSPPPQQQRTCTTPAAAAAASLQGTLGRTVGGHNAVQVRSEYLGVTHYTGPGAGRFPTANSVVADMLAIALGEAASLPFPPVTDPLSSPPAWGPGPCRYYVRVPAAALGGSAAQRTTAARQAVVESGHFAPESVKELDGSECVCALSPASGPLFTLAHATAAAGALEEKLRLPAGSVVAMPVWDDL